MDRQPVRARTPMAPLLWALGALAVTACGKPALQGATLAPPPGAALALSKTATPIVRAPTTDALPSAPLMQIGQPAGPDVYAYAEDAYAMNAGFGDAPPDFTFDYIAGERPWVWRGDDGSMRIAERLPEGRNRYYYCAPGANAPFLVRDGAYGYAYDYGVLAAIYGPDGRPLSQRAMRRYADPASRLFMRGRDEVQALRANRHESVSETNWLRRQHAVDVESQQWSDEMAADPKWRAYHHAHEAEDAYWAAERFRREAEAARYAQKFDERRRAATDWAAAEGALALAADGRRQQAAKPGVFGFGRPPRRSRRRSSLVSCRRIQ